MQHNVSQSVWKCVAHQTNNEKPENKLNKLRNIPQQSANKKHNWQGCIREAAYLPKAQLLPSIDLHVNNTCILHSRSLMYDCFWLTEQIVAQI